MRRTDESKISQNDFVDIVVDDAIFNFWQYVASRYPEVKTGDMEPVEVFKFGAMVRHAVYSWLEANSGDGLNNMPKEFIATMRREEVAFHMNKSTERVYWDEETWRNLKSRLDFLDKEEHIFLFAWDEKHYWPGCAETHNYGWMSSNEDLLLGDKELIADLRVGQSTGLRIGLTVTRLS